MSSHKKMNGKFIGKKKRKIEKKWKKEEGANTNDSKGKPFSSTAKHSPLVGHESDQKWYESQFDEVRAEGSAMPADELVQRAQKRGEELLSRDIARFAQSYRSQNRADADWLEMVANRGTFPDRLSALQLRIRRSAVHALPQLRQFVQLAQRKGAKIRQAHTLTKALKDIFLHELLPPKRKLLTMAQRPLEQWVNPTANNKSEADKRLLMWHFEAELKQLYHQFFEGLQCLAGNTAEGVALAGCQDIAELLAERPEQEQQLLGALVNKLGHPTQRVGAGVAQCLERTVVQRHPNMRSVVISEVETLVFRKNISPKAQRYAVHFLSRVILDAGEAELALQLIRIYLKLFHILVAKDALADHPKLLPLLITGLNRAFPYAKGRTSEVLDNVGSLYTIVQTAKFSTALSVLRLLFQIHSASDGLSDRFYTAFYRRLLNLQPGNQQHDSQLFTLAQQVLRNDLVECRVRAFLKRFFQIALSANSAFAAAILLMCHSVVRERPQLIKMGRASNDEDKRAQTITTTTRPTKAAAVATTIHCGGDKEGTVEEEEEHYEDVDVQLLGSDGDDDEGTAEKKEAKEEETEMDNAKGRGAGHSNSSGKRRKMQKQQQQHSQQQKQQGWTHRRRGGEGATPSAAAAPGARRGGVHAYDPTVRNPLFAGAEWAVDDELGTLAHHFHPTVSAFAQALIKGQPITYRGDPLIDLSQMRFLDRFAFKNPKKQRPTLALRAATNGGTDSAGGGGPSLFAHSYAPSGVKALNPTSQDYLSKKSTEIPLDERFLHHFATMKFKNGAKETEKQKKKKKREEDEDDDVASLDSDEFDVLMERFEPGEGREVFDVDFGTEFGTAAARKDDRKRAALKRKRKSGTSMDSSSGSDDDEDGGGGLGEDEEEDDDGFDDDEIDEDDDDELEADESGEDEDGDDDDDGIAEYDDEFDDDDDGTDGEEEEDELEFD
ncbi:hypothetical protein niasHT_006485 [Heterodera trifolii]|uniref:CCAAT-binding factor domain-containing protein n=1 Tax=Heterodera trifolii TaxID=157864 RepID=A0ABD2LTT7_9BILA